MSPVLRNILALLAGLISGSILNGFIVGLNSSVIGLPEGADVNSMEGLKASMQLFEPKHFLFPFLGHAFGTLAGAYVTASIAASRHLRLSLAVGIAFLAGGVYMVYYLPSPLWFTLLDIVVAYLPMAWLGWKMAGAKQ